MSKEEFLKIKTCVLRVNIDCDGCKQKVKKILQKIDGVYTTKIDSEQGKVTVSGNIDPGTIIKKLGKSGKHAEIWGATKGKVNQNQLANHFNNMQIENGKGGNNNKGCKTNNGGGGGGGGGNNQPKQQQQIKGLQDMKLPPQFKDMKMQPNQNPGQKGMKFDHDEDDLSDDEFDDDYDDDDFDDEFDDTDDDVPKNKGGKPVIPGGNGNGNGNSQIPPHIMMMMNAQKGANNGGYPGGNGLKAGVLPVQANNNGGKKNGGGEGSHGGAQFQPGKNGSNGGGAKIGNGTVNNVNMNGVKNGGAPPMNNGFQNMTGHPAMAGANMSQIGNMGMPPLSQMCNIPAAQGLPMPSVALNGGGGYLHGSGAPDSVPGNPYHHQQQQQYMAPPMMNQHMMYVGAPQDMNYFPSPSPPPPPQPYPHYNPYYEGDPHAHHYSDDNTSGCNVM